jgi:hypothetical protein
VSLKEPVEARAGDLQDLGGPRLVALCGVKDALDVTALDLAQRRQFIHRVASPRRRQVLGSNHVSCREHECARQGVFELSYISGPVVSEKSIHGLLGDHRRLYVKLLGRMSQKVLGKARKIREPIPQRGYVDLHDP